MNMMRQPAFIVKDYSTMDDSTDSSLIVWLICVLSVIVLGYIFYPALVAAAAPEIESDEVTINVSASSARAVHEKRKEESILLSLIIPAYNEELRLETMLREAYDYLTHKDGCPALAFLSQAAPLAGRHTRVEFVVVDDGSSDQTERVYRDFAKAHAPKDVKNTTTRTTTTTTACFRLLRLRSNAGKGAAVQAGMLAARGAFSLMVDADGATSFGPGLQAVAAHAASHDFILGSRADLERQNNHGQGATTSDSRAAQKVSRTKLRSILQAGFHLLVVFLVGTSEIQDTQCGFKLFRGAVVPLLFDGLHLRRWAFDTELLYRAAGIQLRLQEVSVPWHEVDGSHLNTGPLALARVATGMLRDMLCVRLCYSLRIWSLPKPQRSETDKDR